MFILNPNGVLFGQGAQINVGGLLASTHGMNNSDFMAGNYLLSGNGSGNITNQGQITVPLGGTVALIAPIVRNTGEIHAPQGSVLLAAADQVSLKLQDGSLIAYTLDKGSLQALVDNGGLIQAEGGHVVLTAKALDTLAKASVNHSGIIEAQTVTNKNGTVELLGDMTVGEVKLAGKIDASAPNGGDGGFVETSAAHIDLNAPHQVSTLSTFGKTGTWLIDPKDFVIGAGGNISAQQVQTDLKTNDITYSTRTQGTDGGNGDILVNDAFTWNTHKLTLSAGRNIQINANLIASGTASLALEYGQDAGANGNTANYYVNNGSKISLPSGESFSTKLGNNGATNLYTVITELGVEGDVSTNTFQGMKNNLTGFYAFGSDINASPTSDWNGGLGWESIGKTTPFSGTLAGLGHNVFGVFIGSTAPGNQGIFSQMSGSVRDLHINNAYVSTTAGGWVGILSGVLVSGGHISNVSTSGVVEDISGASGSTGGLVGAAANNTIIERSMSSADVRGNHAAGGLVGFSFSLIQDSYATGPVILNTYAAGGLVGINNGSILRSYSTGKVIGSGLTGGLVGLAGRDAPSFISDSYWDIESSGQSSSSGSVGGKSTAEMKKQTTFAGWDFVNTWDITEGSSYPKLQHERTNTTTPTPSITSLDPNSPPYNSAITDREKPGKTDRSELNPNNKNNNNRTISDDSIYEYFADKLSDAELDTGAAQLAALIYGIYAKTSDNSAIRSLFGDAAASRMRGGLQTFAKTLADELNKPNFIGASTDVLKGALISILTDQAKKLLIDQSLSSMEPGTLRDTLQEEGNLFIDALASAADSLIGSFSAPSSHGVALAKFQLNFTTQIGIISAKETWKLLKETKTLIDERNIRIDAASESVFSNALIYAKLEAANDYGNTGAASVLERLIAHNRITDPFDVGSSYGLGNTAGLICDLAKAVHLRIL